MFGDAEPVKIRKQNVEQDDIGAEICNPLKRFRAAGCCSHNVVATCRQETLSEIAKARMVVDDQYPQRHRLMVPGGPAWQGSGTQNHGFV